MLNIARFPVVATALLAGSGLTFAASGTNLDTMVVSASRIETPLRQVGASMSVITHEELALRGYSSLADVLATQPGITFSNNGGPGKLTSLQVRGEAGFRTLVLIDGVSALDPSGPQASARIEHLLLTDSIERIEILRGPQAFLYGGHAGGVVNIITRSAPEGTAFTIANQAGRYGYRQSSGSVSHSDKGRSITFALHDESTQGINTLKADASGEVDGYENTTAELKMHLALSEALSVGVSGRRVEADNAYDNCFSATENCDGQYSQSLANVEVLVSGRQVEQTFMFNFNETQSAYLTDDAKIYETGGQKQQGSYLANFSLRESLGWMLGFDFQRDKLQAGSFRHQRAVLTEWQWLPNEVVTMTFGVRHDDHDDFGEHTSGRGTASVFHAVSEDSALKYRASIGNGFRAPSLYEVANDLAMAPGSGVTESLTEETSQGWDVGLDWFMAASVFTLTYFNQTIVDEIDYDSTLWGYRQFAGTNRSRGVEVTGDVPVGQGFSLMGNATYNETFDRNGQQRPRRPKQIGNAGVRWRSVTGQLNAIANIRFARDAIDIGGSEVANYAVVDVGGSYQLTPELSLSGRLENLTDRDYELARGYQTAGRSFMAGFRLTY